MNEQAAGIPAADEVTDILFECPHCGKSLEIDARGAGFTVVCPDCKREVQVPDVSGDGGADDAPTERIAMENLVNQFQQKIAELEKQQRADAACFKRLSDEVTLIQAALDRINEIVESRRA